jgi:peptidoglycan/xylan/chitin deacetylase (PgdA/CDA1 family)
MYHAVVRSPLEVPDWCFLDEAAFRSQVHYLKQHFDVLPLSEAVARLSSGALQRPTVAITLDDGFQNNHEVAFPILREAGLPATVFLVTGLVDSDDTIWFCRVNRAVAAATAPWFEWEGRRFNLAGPAAKAESSHLIQERLKRFPHPELLSQLRQVVLALGDDPDRPIEAGSPFRILNREAIAEMAASGLIEFGAHTRSHAILSRLPPEARRDEIEQSLSAILKLTGRRCELFAYPNGTGHDYDVESIRILEANGVRAAVTVTWGANDRATPTLELRRYGVGPDWSVAALSRAMRFG